MSDGLGLERFYCGVPSFRGALSCRLLSRCGEVSSDTFIAMATKREVDKTAVRHLSANA